jgi:predicted nucleic acid-binding Zn ribbon protein
MSESGRINLFSASEVLQSLLQNSKSPISDQFLRWKLWRQWGDIVGEEISQRTLPVHYDNGTLVLYVESSVWLQHLTFIATPIRKKINKHLDREWVRSIRFTLDRRSVPSVEESEEGLKTYLSTSTPSGDGEPPLGR